MATSAIVALIVSVIATFTAVLGALAFARHAWRDRNFYQKLILIPIFFPQTVLGLALQIWFSWIGIHRSWQASIIAHLVWISPIVMLVIAIQFYGRNRLPRSERRGQSGVVRDGLCRVGPVGHFLIPGIRDRGASQVAR